DCHYTESDEWVRVDGALVRVGITDYAQSELNDVVFVELPEAGSQTEAGQAFGVVESGKAVSDLLAPIAGEVTEVHGRLSEHPEWLNEDPYGRGWIIALTPGGLEAQELSARADRRRGDGVARPPLRASRVAERGSVRPRLDHRDHAGGSRGARRPAVSRGVPCAREGARREVSYAPHTAEEL